MAIKSKYGKDNPSSTDDALEEIADKVQDLADIKTAVESMNTKITADVIKELGGTVLNPWSLGTDIDWILEDSDGVSDFDDKYQSAMLIVETSSNWNGGSSDKFKLQGQQGGAVVDITDHQDKPIEVTLNAASRKWVFFVEKLPYTYLQGYYTFGSASVGSIVVKAYLNPFIKAEDRKQTFDVLNYGQVTFDNTVQVNLPSIPDGAMRAVVAIEKDATDTATIIARYTEDGDALFPPTGSFGMPVTDLMYLEVLGNFNINNFRIIGVTAGKTHTIRVNYYKD